MTQILKARDSSGNPHDLAIEIPSLVKWGLLTYSFIPDDANRLLGKVSVTNFPSTYDILDRAGRALGQVSVSNFPASFNVGNFPSTQPVSLVDNAARVLGVVSVSNFPASSTVDVSDRIGRVLGVASISNFPTSFQVSNFPASFQVSNFPTSFNIGNFPATQAVSLANDANRILGHVVVDNALAITGGVDITDRALRLLGRVEVTNYASFPDDVTVLNFPSVQNVELADDPTRELGVVTLNTSTPVTVNNMTTLIAEVDALEEKLQELIDLSTTDADLTARMLEKKPSSGYALWFDTADISYIYTLEAPVATAAGDTGFRGIRVTINAAGYPVGKVQVNTGGTLTWNNRTSDGGWT